MSLDFYDLTGVDAVQGRSPGDIVDARVDTLDPFFCNSVGRSSSGRINIVDNQSQNIGKIEASGYDIDLTYRGIIGGYGRFGLRLNATLLDEFTEFTSNPDGTFNRNDRAGTITDETFQRAFPELKFTTVVNWTRERWGGDLSFRYVDDMMQTSGNTLDSLVYTDLQIRFSTPTRGNLLTIVVGATNLLDEDPSLCDSRGIIGMSPVVHDLPGSAGYVRLSFQMD